MIFKNDYNYNRNKKRFNNFNILLSILSIIVLMIGLSYAAVPIYRIFCQITGYGGTTQIIDKNAKVSEEAKEISENRIITVKFNADVSASMPWTFQPLQKEMKVMVGETALAFYVAENPTSNSITGISTYNVTPQQAGIYFNKIQCFCFEEQRLKANESIDMPVFFFIDPEILDDPRMDDVDTITLSYTFFNVND